MAITPQTDLYLIKSPLESDNLNQLTFSSKTDQVNYFSNLPHLLVQNFTYQRRDNVIRYPGHIDSIQTYNYVMYRNNNYTNKYFYAFITRMEYVNDNMTHIYIKTDVYQSWLFDLEFKKSFVEREHVNDDGLGKHTIPENLETGEYIQLTNPVKLNNYDNGSAICVAVSDYPESLSVGSDKVQKTVNGIYSGLKYCIFSHSEGISKEAEWVNDFINMYDSSAKGQAIMSIFLVPKVFAITDHASIIQFPDTSSSKFFYLPTENSNFNTLVESVSVSRPTHLGGSYVPKNNKMLCYPYNYFVVSNNAGTDVVFNYEDFVSNNPSFKIIGDITPGCSIKCIPLNYKKVSDSSGSMNSFNYGVAGCKLPICSWTNDTYTNWLTENGVNMNLGVVGGVVAIGLGVGSAIATGGVSLGVAASVIGGVGTIANTLASNYQHSLAPDQAGGNTSTGDITYTSGNAVFTVYKMGIREEYAKICDNFMSMYGYKVNTLKVPNITGRRNWNYVKTIGANIEGNIPQADIEELKSIFNNGVTLWHNTSTFLDYSQNNDII